MKAPTRPPLVKRKSALSYKSFIFGAIEEWKSLTGPISDRIEMKANTQLNRGVDSKKAFDRHHLRDSCPPNT